MTGWFLLWYKCICVSVWVCVWNIAAFFFFFFMKTMYKLKCFNVRFDYFVCTMYTLILKDNIPRVKIHNHKLCLEIFVVAFSVFYAPFIMKLPWACACLSLQTRTSPQTKEVQFYQHFFGNSQPNPMAFTLECDIRDLKSCHVK